MRHAAHFQSFTARACFNQPGGLVLAQKSYGGSFHSSPVFRVCSSACDNDTAMPADIVQRTASIRQELATLRRRLQDGDESELIVWIIPRQLACSQRPLRYHKRFGGSARTLTPDAAPHVAEW